MTELERKKLLQVLATRFAKYPGRHEGIVWADVLHKLETSPGKLRTLYAMEATGGDPDVVGLEKSGEHVFFDCAVESPTGRRSVCYDRPGLESRKENRPTNNALDLAAEMGVEILTEAQYRHLQNLGEFDTKTSSWIQTPSELRALGGALFCDRRYGQVFVYHNGAQSYYAARAFRGSVSV